MNLCVDTPTCAFHYLFPKRNKLLMSHFVECTFDLMTAVTPENALSLSSPLGFEQQVNKKVQGIFVFGS